MSIMKPPFHTELNLGHRLAQGIVGCWLFNEAPPPLGSAMDLSGNGNHGTLVGNTHSAPGRFGPALEFDGNGDYVDAGDPVNGNMDFGTGSFSISVWVNRDAYKNNDGWVSKYQGSNIGWYFGSSTVSPYSGIFFKYGDGSPSSIQYSSEIAPLGTWVHVVAVHNNSRNDKMYVNGTEVVRGGSSAYNTNNSASIQIGALLGSSNEMGAGRLDHVLIYNRALSAGEISDLYRDPFQMFKRNL